MSDAISSTGTSRGTCTHGRYTRLEFCADCRVKELHASLVAALAEKDRALALIQDYGIPTDRRVCLNCGQSTPCELDKEETAGMPPGKWPGSPCTFDPTYKDVWERWKQAKSEKDRALAQLAAGEASDGYHTHKELYEYRMIYNALLFNQWAALGMYDVHKSLRHSDGEVCFGGGWFIVVAQLPAGQVSNHYKVEYWDLFQVESRPQSVRYDGHDAQEALSRMKSALADLPAEAVGVLKIRKAAFRWHTGEISLLEFTLVIQAHYRAMGTVVSAPRLRVGPPQDGDYLIVGRERWIIDQPKAGDPVGLTTPQRGGVFRVTPLDLIGAGMPLFQGTAVSGEEEPNG